MLRSLVGSEMCIRDRSYLDLGLCFKEGSSIFEDKFHFLLQLLQKVLGNLVGYSILDQIFFCDSVVLESTCYRTRGERLIKEGNTTGSLRKFWTGIQNDAYSSIRKRKLEDSPVSVRILLYLRSSRLPTRPIFFCDPVVLESICHRTSAKQLINKGNTTGGL